MDFPYLIALRINPVLSALKRIIEKMKNTFFSICGLLFGLSILLTVKLYSSEAELLDMITQLNQHRSKNGLDLVV